ncbi:fructokinase [Actinoplanes italicus]|uniref:Fructokinase n=1 Tax=Actinoplanes italicus TaxID=113567 RepID=A0A2T0JBT8_9ACTN|nr:carbohydrate kinase [Actinoplanes italicus]PRX05116.1 fructokinase [Actinoplanes italicus]GIE36972.1 fructokinase [Actinoplanes italicus]
MGYAMVMGEALIDLLEADLDGEQVYRQAIGGAPLNVAVGVARLGGDVRYAGTLGRDVLGDRIAAFLRDTGVDDRGVRRVAVPTTLAVTTFEGAEPTFTFYGEPPSYALLGADDVDLAGVAGAAVLYTGSICLLREPFRAAARTAWRTAGPLRVFDPNVRPTLLPDATAVDGLRDLAEEFFATADLVKLSSADAVVLYGEHDPADAAARIRALGAGAVVVTCGSKGAYVDAADGTAMIPAPVVDAIDATGAGDSVMAALVSRLLVGGRPEGLAVWTDYVRFALSVAGLVCERQGGATAMPTPADLQARWG